MQNNKTNQVVLAVKFISTVSLLVGPLVGCGGGGLSANPSWVSGADGISSESSITSSSGDSGAREFASSTGTGTTGLPKFCSPLAFDGIVWDPKVDMVGRRSLAISLSLSGSFEGPSGWANLTNDFDGQGLSAGLLNQTLGTGSLEPLLAQVEASDPQIFVDSFSPAHRASILKMIDTWRAARGWKAKAVETLMRAPASLGNSGESIPGAEIVSSPLDMDYNVDGTLAPSADSSTDEISARDSMHLLSSSAVISPEQAAVNWAVANLYNSNGTFISTWKTELTHLLNDPRYISVQVSASETYYQKALSYVARVGTHDLRSYLLMFDIVIQNGGLLDSEFTAWTTAVRNITDPSARLKALVDIRLKRVLTQYVADVRDRKYAIINGTGVVHGSSRNFPREYCYASSDAIQ